MSSKIITIDATLFSPAYNTFALGLAELALEGEDRIELNPVMSTVTLHGEHSTTEAKVDADVLRCIVGLYGLPAILRNGLPTLSWEFIETVARHLGMAFGCGELELVADITPEMYETEMDHAPFSAFRVDYLQRWRQHGTVCMTDVLFEDKVWVGHAETRPFPTVYPVLVVGKYFSLNQQVTVPHTVTRQALGKEGDGPTVCGATIYRSLGTAKVEQRGVTAKVTFNDTEYLADIMGCVPVNATLDINSQ